MTTPRTGCDTIGVDREPIERVPGLLFIARSVVELAGAEESIMASSEKKRAREQNAAARRDRAAQKRIEKSAASSRAEVPAKAPEAPPAPVGDA
jgi:hypothetical protein